MDWLPPQLAQLAPLESLVKKLVRELCYPMCVASLIKENRLDDLKIFLEVPLPKIDTMVKWFRNHFQSKADVTWAHSCVSFLREIVIVSVLKKAMTTPKSDIGFNFIDTADISSYDKQMLDVHKIRLQAYMETKFDSVTLSAVDDEFKKKRFDITIMSILPDVFLSRQLQNPTAEWWFVSGGEKNLFLASLYQLHQRYHDKFLNIVTIPNRLLFVYFIAAEDIVSRYGEILSAATGGGETSQCLMLKNEELYLLIGLLISDHYFNQTDVHIDLFLTDFIKRISSDVFAIFNNTQALFIPDQTLENRPTYKYTNEAIMNMNNQELQAVMERKNAEVDAEAAADGAGAENKEGTADDGGDIGDGLVAAGTKMGNVLAGAAQQGLDGIRAAMGGGNNSDGKQTRTVNIEDNNGCLQALTSWYNAIKKQIPDMQQKFDNKIKKLQGESKEGISDSVQKQIKAVGKLFSERENIVNNFHKQETEAMKKKKMDEKEYNKNLEVLRVLTKKYFDRWTKPIDQIESVTKQIDYFTAPIQIRLDKENIKITDTMKPIKKLWSTHSRAFKTKKETVGGLGGKLGGLGGKLGKLGGLGGLGFGGFMGGGSGLDENNDLKQASGPARNIFAAALNNFRENVLGHSQDIGNALSHFEKEFIGKTFMGTLTGLITNPETGKHLTEAARDVVADMFKNHIEKLQSQTSSVRKHYILESKEYMKKIICDNIAKLPQTMESHYEDINLTIQSFTDTVEINEQKNELVNVFNNFYIQYGQILDRLTAVDGVASSQDTLNVSAFCGFLKSKYKEFHIYMQRIAAAYPNIPMTKHMSDAGTIEEECQKITDMLLEKYQVVDSQTQSILRQNFSEIQTISGGTKQKITALYNGVNKLNAFSTADQILTIFKKYHNQVQEIVNQIDKNIQSEAMMAGQAANRGITRKIMSSVNHRFDWPQLLAKQKKSIVIDPAFSAGHIQHLYLGLSLYTKVISSCVRHQSSETHVLFSPQYESSILNIAMMGNVIREYCIENPMCFIVTEIFEKTKMKKYFYEILAIYFTFAKQIALQEMTLSQILDNSLDQAGTSMLLKAAIKNSEDKELFIPNLDMLSTSFRTEAKEIVKLYSEKFELYGGNQTPQDVPESKLPDLVVAKVITETKLTFAKDREIFDFLTIWLQSFPSTNKCFLIEMYIQSFLLNCDIIDAVHNALMNIAPHLLLRYSEVVKEDLNANGSRFKSYHEKTQWFQVSFYTIVVHQLNLPVKNDTFRIPFQDKILSEKIQTIKLSDISALKDMFERDAVISALKLHPWIAMEIS